MLSERCQAILLAARRGFPIRPEEEEPVEKVEPIFHTYVDENETPGLLARKWTLFSKDFEPKEREFLAKRRKGLRSLYGGSTVPMNTTGQMRKIKIRTVDSEGNSQIVEALVPEGQAVDAEIVEEEATSPTQALAPGTKVEGVGIANSEGVLVPVEQATPSTQRRRPPPPKRRNKGPGRGRKKKVAFASGADGSTASAPLQVANGVTPGAVESSSTTGVQSVTGDNDQEDSIMQDAGQDGEEGSEDGSEGEEGEILGTPETEDPKGQPILKVESQTDKPKHISPSEPPALPTVEVRTPDDMVIDQPVALQKEELVPSQESVSEVVKDFSPKDNDKAPVITQTLLKEEVKVQITSSSQSVVEPTDKPTAEPPAMSSHMDVVEDGQISKSGIPGLQSQEPIKTMDEQLNSSSSAEPVSGSGEPLPGPSLATDLETVTQDSLEVLNTSVSQHQENIQVDQSIPSSHIEMTSSTVNQNHVASSHSSPPPHHITRDLPEPAAPPSENQVPPSTLSHSSDVRPGLVPPTSAETIVQEQEETLQPIAIDSGLGRIHHSPHAPTPEAPTPSPPTPLPLSFDPHQRERLMESPRAPTMSPPTPARDLSSSPDLPLAGHRGLPPLSLDSAANTKSRGSSRTSPTRDDDGDVQGAFSVAKKLAPETLATSHPNQHRKDGEHLATGSDGEEDLLGNLERSLE